MARRRCITEMGMGVDVHGRDATKAAKRAVSDAIRHSSLGFMRMLGKTAHDMIVDVTIGVPNPDAVDTAAVAKELPYGKVTVTAVKGVASFSKLTLDETVLHRIRRHLDGFGDVNEGDFRTLVGFFHGALGHGLKVAVRLR